MKKYILLILTLISLTNGENLKFLEDKIYIEKPSTISLKSTEKLESLDVVLKPKSVAVIGVSTKKFAPGYELLARLVEMKFKGPIYPINPKAKEILGLKVYKSILDVPGTVDLAAIIVKSSIVLDTIDMCHQKGVKGLVMITAGFKEIDKEGAQVEEELMRRVRKYGMRLVGPNCIGISNTNPSVSLDASFALKVPNRGNVGLASQSGALIASILNKVGNLNLGFSQFLSIGNQPDISAESLIEYWENDADIELILLYMEGMKDFKHFRTLASRISKKKPIVVLKSGSSAAGTRAALYHTGSIAGNDKFIDTLFSIILYNFV